MKKLILTLSFFCAFNAIAEDSQELKFLGKTIIHEDGSWVNPEEPEWKLKKPKTWFKRNYVRHYMQGSQEVTDSIIKIDWKKLKDAAKSGENVPAKAVIQLFKFKDTYKAVKTHPEAAIVPVGMAVGSAAEGSKGTVMATVGLLKNVGVGTLKIIKFVSSPVISQKQHVENESKN